MKNEKIIAEINGQRAEFDVYFTFICQQLNKAYIGYTDHTLDEEGKEKLYVSAYDPNVGINELSDIQTQEEWDLINSVIDKIRNLG